MRVRLWRVLLVRLAGLVLALVVAGSAQAGDDHEPLRNADLSKHCTNNLPASDPTVGTYTRTADPPDLAADWVTLCFYEAP